MIARHTVIVIGALFANSCGERPPETAAPEAPPIQTAGSSPTALSLPAPQLSAQTESELQSLVGAAFGGSDTDGSEEAFATLLEKLTPENASRVYEMITAIKPEGSQDNIKRLVAMRRQFRRVWAAVDGGGAITYGLEQFNGERLGVFVRDLLPAWASADPEAAIAWANDGGARKIDATYRKLDDYSYGRFGGSADHDVPHFVVRGLAETDLELAADYASQFEDDKIVYVFELFEVVSARSLTERGADATLAWAESIDRVKLRHAAVFGLAMAQAHSDPAGAASWFGSYVDQPWAGQVVRTITNELMEVDPDAAVEWRDDPAG